MYERSYSEKHEAGMDIKDIAKAVRADIKAAQKEGTLPKMKISVRTERYSGGQSLSVTIKEFPIQILNIWRVKIQKENPNYFIGHICEDHPAYEMYTPLAKKALAKLKEISNAYNYDGSETMVDYFDVNYYEHVGFDYRIEGTERRELEENVAKIEWPALWLDYLN